MQKVFTSGPVMTVPVSDFTGKRVEAVAAQLGPDTEALIMKNKDVLGVFMSVERRNALARTEAELETAMVVIDMLAAGDSFDDVRRSAREAAEGRFMTAEDFLAELGG